MRLVILDRDGVINRDSAAYIKSPAEWRPLPGSLEAIARLSRAEYRVVVATNQSAIGRGLMDTGTLNLIHNRMLDEVHDKGGDIEAIFFCPHRPDDRCRCRKPRAGLFEMIAERLKVSIRGVPMVGDSLRDLAAARAVNGLAVLVTSGKNELALAPDTARLDHPDYPATPVFVDLAAFTDALLDGQLDARIDQPGRGAGA